MSDTFSEIFSDPAWTASGQPLVAVAPEWFDESAYLRAHLDVAAALARGELPSGYYHYISKGRAEKRSLYPKGHSPRNRLMRTLPALDTVAPKTQVPLNIDAMLISESGGIMVVGWLDDTNAPLDHLQVEAPGWYYTFDASSIVRIRRPDVEASLGSSRAYKYGFLAFAFAGMQIDAASSCNIAAVIQGREPGTISFKPRSVDDVELRNMVLSYVAQAEFFGNRQIEAIRALDGSIGRHVIAHNLHITRSVVAGACVERFGAPRKSLRGSIVVCLYGKSEFVFLQNALFAGGLGFEDYELIYVSNSPEMAERLLKEARAAEQVYGLPQTVVLLPGNAGFGAANNVAVNHARSDRILIVNPDVFPRDLDWARKHTNVVADLPAHQTRIFGVPMYYDDGSLMHGGMYFEFDTGVSVDAGHMVQRRMLRVEHYGKGAPPSALQFLKPRPIQAVTGAFISIERAWFEKLSGFTEDYVFGHYEDADLCLKSMQNGTVPWLHDIRLCHLEGKGSTRLPVHEGGSLINRWLFTETWGAFVADGLSGPNPTSLLLDGRSGGHSPVSKPGELALVPAPAAEALSAEFISELPPAARAALLRQAMAPLTAVKPRKPQPARKTAR
jgi:hypothetical protein